MFYKILLDLDSENNIFISDQLLSDYNISGITTKDSVTVCAGQQKYNSNVIISNELQRYEIKISNNIANYLSIPIDIEYQIYISGNEIHIGPIIGLLLNSKRKGYSNKRLSEYLKYTLKYEEIKGLLCIFTVDDIDFGENLVKGLYYNPNSKINNGWVKGEFPIPDSIFRRTGLPKLVEKKLKKLTNNKMFNSYFFNKWQFWNLASNVNSIKDYVPYTEIARSVDNINKMVEKYGFVYLKRVGGTFSRGIVRLSKEDDKYTVKTNESTKIIEFETKERLAKFFYKNIFKKRYLVQQGIDVIKLTDGFTSFRCIMQKNQYLNWQCTGIIARIGESRGVSSNYDSWGYGLTFEEFFKKSLSLSDEEIFKKKQEVIDICLKTCEMIDKKWGNFGDVGIDIGIDTSLKVWIFEVNKTHMHYIPLKINDYNMYYTVKTMPIRYAAALGGFKIYNKF
jgi:hypothetical protein